MNGNKKNQNNTPAHFVSTKQVTISSAPVPDPAQLEHYDRVLPGAAKMIFDNWTKQVDHRQGIERIVIRSGVRRESLGMWLGFFIAI